VGADGIFMAAVLLRRRMILKQKKQQMSEKIPMIPVMTRTAILAPKLRFESEKVETPVVLGLFVAVVNKDDDDDGRSTSKLTPGWNTTAVASDGQFVVPIML
jgi:hypothetical protein